MKKLISLLLCVVLLVPALISCSGIKPTAEDKGAEIPVHLCTELYNLDPAYAYLDDSGAKILSLIYEGLFNYDDNGNAVKALCSKYKTYTNRDGEFVAEFTINNTKWSDGRSISANDFVYAWKRILEPEFESKAASLLFDIKNARSCKSGDMSIDDLGLVAAETRVLQVTFEKEIDIDQFILNLASPALVPLREDKINRLPDWASYSATMATNGPFYVKTFVPGDDLLVLERSIYYYRNIENEDEFLDKYVKPYRINILMGASDEAMAAYNDGNLVLNSQIALDSRGDAEVTLENTQCTATYVFNTNRAPFNDANVRKALSMAIDRTELANTIKYATPAGGIIPEGITDTSNKDSFRENGGALIAPNADMATAKKLAASATDKDISITVRDNEIDLAAAEYVKGQWEQLGFTVEIIPLTFEHYTNIEYDQYNDLLHQAYSTRNLDELVAKAEAEGEKLKYNEKLDLYTELDFDVIAIDSQMLSSKAFNELSSYAKPFSGGYINLSAGEFDNVTHLSGYNNDNYDALIEQAFNETDLTKRSQLLHQAEQMLIDEMPVCPLFVYQNAYVKSGDLSKIDTNYFGAVTFTKAALKDYQRFKETDKAE